MMSSADVFVFDLQDLGCRIYTFVTTLLYLLEEAAKHGKEVWVLDRPNPAGRPVEGTLLVPGQESFVGAAPMPMRHGLTMGEMGHWFVEQFGLDVEYRVVPMEGWAPDADSGAVGSGYGWPADRIWINPSPNAASVNMARCYAGYGDAGRHDAERRARHHPPARSAVRRAGRRCEGGGKGDAEASLRTGARGCGCAIAGSSRPSTSTQERFATH